MGQVAMAIDHGGQPTMPTGDAGSPIGGRSSETREEAVTGGVDGPPVAQGATGCWQSRQRERTGCAILQSDYSSKYYKKYYELHHCAS